MSRRALRIALAAAGLLAFAAAAHACPVCGAEGTARNRAAFFNSTMFLSLLPLGMIATGLWWVRRRMPRDLAGEFEVTDSSGGAGDAGAPPR